MTPSPLRTLALSLTALGLCGCRATINEVANATDDALLGYSIRNMMVIGAVGAAAWYVIDPAAPNWEVARTQISPTRYRIELRMKRFHTGGDGEAEPLFTRHAEGIAEDLGAGEYRLVSYNEGIDSETAVARRWARGVIELLPARAAQRGEHTARRRAAAC